MAAAVGRGAVIFEGFVIPEQVLVDTEPELWTGSWGKALKLQPSWQERSGVYYKPDKKR